MHHKINVFEHITGGRGCGMRTVASHIFTDRLLRARGVVMDIGRQVAHRRGGTRQRFGLRARVRVELLIALHHLAQGDGQRRRGRPHLAHGPMHRVHGGLETAAQVAVHALPVEPQVEHADFAPDVRAEPGQFFGGDAGPFRTTPAGDVTVAVPLATNLEDNASFIACPESLPSFADMSLVSCYQTTDVAGRPLKLAWEAGCPTDALAAP